MTEAVVAGSRGFALALLAPLAARIGTRPRVAADPSQVLALCRGPGGLAVVEFQGEDTLRAIQRLVLQGSGLRIVAAVPAALAAADEPLRALGVQLVRWDGRADGVLAAVFAPPVGPSPARSPAPPSIPAPTGAPAPAPAPAALAPASPPTAAAGLFDGVGSELDVDLDDAAPLDATAPGAAPPDAGPWPLGAPDAVAAADALGRALLGDAGEPGTVAGVAAAVVASLTDLERGVFSGAPQPVDAEPVRRAAIMRVRAAAAVAAAPGPGGAVDAGAVSAFLAEIDALLSDVNALTAAAPAELHPALEALRNALVRDAIDFSEAAQRASPAGVPLEAPVAHGRATPGARVVSVASRAARELEDAQARRQRRAVAALVVALLLAGAFHGHRWWIRAHASDGIPSRSGAPAGATVVAGPTGSEPVVVRTRDGKPFAPDDLERLRQAESLRGNVVRELGPGTVLVLRAEQLGGLAAPPEPR